MENLKTIPKSKINRIRKSPSESGLAFEKYGKSKDVYTYTDLEISEMTMGVYRHSKNLLVDGDYFVDLAKVTATKCVLEKVTYNKKPTLEEYEANTHNHIANIRTFYIKDYYLVTEQEICGLQEHKITKYFYKVGFLNQGRNQFRGLYSIANCYKTIHNGKYPKDLFHPIKRYINGLFFRDDYKISEFVVESDLKIHS